MDLFIRVSILIAFFAVNIAFFVIAIRLGMKVARKAREDEDRYLNIRYGIAQEKVAETSPSAKVSLSRKDKRAAASKADKREWKRPKDYDEDLFMVPDDQ